LDTSSSLSQAKAVPFTREPLLLGSYRAFSQDRLGFLTRLAAEREVIGFHIGPVPMLLFTTAEQAHAILVEHADAFSKGKLMRRAVGNNGLFVSEGEFYRKQRKLMAPCFQPRHLVSYANTIVHYAEQLMQEWTEDMVIDLNQAMIRLTMSIIGKVLFDTEFLSEADELGAAINTGMAHAVRTLTSPFTLPLAVPTPYNQHVRQAMRLVENRLRQMMAERRQNPGERNDLLSLLLQARDDEGQPMSEQQAIDECLTLFTAGHETSAAALAWTWYLLCQHPESYQHLQQEVTQELRGNPPTSADLPRLPYGLQIFKETLRLYPPAPGILREAVHDIVIDGYRGTDTFAEPEQFSPERFTPAQEQLLPPCAYLPFSAGPRICIGNHFALMEGQLLIAAIAQRVTFSLVPGQQIVPDVVHHLALRPGGEVRVRVHFQATSDRQTPIAPQPETSLR
jgi:cytochrome P450